MMKASHVKLPSKLKTDTKDPVVAQTVDEAEEQLLQDLWDESNDMSLSAVKRFEAREIYGKQLKRMALNGESISGMSPSWFAKKMPAFSGMKIIGKTIVALNQSGACEIKTKTNPFFPVNSLVGVIQNNYRPILATTHYVQYLMEESSPRSGIIETSFVTPSQAMSGAVIFTKFFCGPKAAVRGDFIKTGTKEDSYGTTMSYSTSEVFQSLIRMYRKVFPQEEDLLKDETFEELIAKIQERGKMLLFEDQSNETFHKLTQDNFEDVKDTLMVSISKVDAAISKVLSRFLLTKEFQEANCGRKKVEIYRNLNSTKELGIDFEERDSKLYDFVEGPIVTMVEALAAKKVPFAQNDKGRSFQNNGAKAEEMIWLYSKQNLSQLPKITEKMLEQKSEKGWRLSNDEYHKVQSSRDSAWKKLVLDGLDKLRVDGLAWQVPKRGEKRVRGGFGAKVTAANGGVKAEDSDSDI